MFTAKVTSKGQITIPKDVRYRLGLDVGERVAFEEKSGRFYLKKIPKESPFGKWKGKLQTLAGKTSDKIVDDLRGE